MIVCFDWHRQGVETARLRFAVEQRGPRDRKVENVQTLRADSSRGSPIASDRVFARDPEAALMPASLPPMMSGAVDPLLARRIDVWPEDGRRSLPSGRECSRHRD